MFSGFWGYLLGGVTSASVISAVFFIFRDSLFKAFSHRLEIKLEEVRGDIRKGEGELTSIRDYIFSRHRDRDLIVQSKKMEAAEVLLKMRDAAYQLSIAVNYIKFLDVDKLATKLTDPNVKDFVDSIYKSLSVDEKLDQIDSSGIGFVSLYLDERIVNLYNVYYLIIFKAAMTFKLLSKGIYFGDFLKKGALQDLVIDLCPSSRENFEKYGDNYSYHLLGYFHGEILKSLRTEVLNADSSVFFPESLVVESRRAYANVMDLLDKSGLSHEFLRGGGKPNFK